MGSVLTSTLANATTIGESEWTVEVNNDKTQIELRGQEYLRSLFKEIGEGIFCIAGYKLIQLTAMGWKKMVLENLGKTASVDVDGAI